MLPDTVVAYCDSTIAFPLFCEYAVGANTGTRKRKALYHRREGARRRGFKRQGKAAQTSVRKTRKK